MILVNPSQHVAEKLEDYVKTPEAIQRIVLSSSLEEALGEKGDFLIPLFLPRSVYNTCNELVLEALKANGLSEVPPLRLALLDEHKVGKLSEVEDNLCLAYWYIDSVTGWQQIDRRIDE